MKPPPGAGKPQHRHEYKFSRFRWHGTQKRAVYVCKCGDKYEADVRGLF